MAVIGLILIALAVGFTVDVFVENSQSLDVDVLGRTFSVSPGWIVVGGIVALALFVIGMRLVMLGLRRRRRRTSRLREAESAARERDQLAQQLAAEREHKEVIAEPVEIDDHQVDAVPSTTD
jgi:flagellar biosynthesis/type III secretory pathway M-ring protein FliF/YscJ